MHFLHWINLKLASDRRHFYYSKMMQGFPKLNTNKQFSREVVNTLTKVHLCMPLNNCLRVRQTSTLWGIGYFLQIKTENNTLFLQLKEIYFGYEKNSQKNSLHRFKNMSKPAMVEDTYPSIILLLNTFRSFIWFLTLKKDC